MRADSPLTGPQTSFLQSFFTFQGDSSDPEAFRLGGGTALAAFYLKHRLSEDLDLFTYAENTLRQGLRWAEQALKAGHLEFSVTRDTSDSIRLSVQGESAEPHPLRWVDLVHEPPPMFSPAQRFGNVLVMSLTDLAVGKLGALGNREEVKDFVDLYFLVHQARLDLAELYPLVQQKEVGIDLFRMAESFARVERLRGIASFLESYLLAPLDWDDLVSFCKDEARRLFRLYPPRA